MQVCLAMVALMLLGACSRSELSAHVNAALSNSEPREIEVCTYIGDLPPGLDEEFTCDHSCFADEIGNESKPQFTLHEMYSIGWRLKDIEFARNVRDNEDGSRLDMPMWFLYVERQERKSTNR